MKDAVFSGADVTEAVAAAARALGRSPEGLRFVVLDPGGPGGLGLKPTPARIAVLFENAVAGETPREAQRTEAEPAGWPAAIRRMIEAVAQAAHLDLGLEVVEEAESVRVRLPGPDKDFFLEDGGEPLAALDHLMRKLATPGDRRRLILECEGYRDVRDEALRAEAFRLADDVREDGRPRRTEPLNAYERRIIHVAISELPDLRSYSVGEEGDRRVVVARATDDPAEA